ncbi:MAG: hypothetical protein JOZ05_06750 [Acetobacteraceae bacterium]|nr:hypothetical protein [Acetobacteraceae bacterium]
MWPVALNGALAFLFGVYAGLTRFGSADPIVTGTLLAGLSGLFWYLAAVVPLAFPDRIYAAAGLNMAAAVLAASAACYLVPDERLPMVRSTLAFWTWLPPLLLEGRPVGSY